MSLQELLLQLDSSKDYSLAISTLESHGIKTAKDILFLPPIPIISPTILQELQELIGRHLERNHPPISGAQLFHQSLYAPIGLPEVDENKSRYSTGLPGLDSILNGGFQTREIIQLSGAVGWENSRFSITIILRALAMNAEHKALYVDTSNSFSAESSLDFLKEFLVETEQYKRYDKESDEIRSVAISILERLEVVNCFSSRSVINSINGVIERSGTLDLVIIDNLSGLNFDISNPADLIQFMRELRKLASDVISPLSIFLLNPATKAHQKDPKISQFTGDLIPALGIAFSYLPDITLWITDASLVWRVEGKNKFIIEVARNQRGNSRGWLVYERKGEIMKEVK